MAFAHNICFIIIFSPLYPQIPGYRTWTSEKFGISVDFPLSWTVNSTEKNDVIMEAVRPETNTYFRESVAVCQQPYPNDWISQEDFMNRIIQQFRDMVQLFEVKVPCMPLDVDSELVATLVFECVHASMRMKVELWFLGKQDRMYYIACWASPETYDSYSGTFENIVRSVHFNE